MKKRTIIIWVKTQESNSSKHSSTVQALESPKEQRTSAFINSYCFPTFLLFFAYLPPSALFPFPDNKKLFSATETDPH